jgi:hypothetical protein
MDWKLILGLSLFGLAMAIATVFVIPSSIEPVFLVGDLPGVRIPDCAKAARSPFSSRSAGWNRE